MNTEEQLDRLTGIVESLAGAVVAHDEQIDGLIQVAQKHQEEMAEYSRKHQEEMAELRRAIAETDRLWQAYLKRLPPQ